MFFFSASLDPEDGRRAVRPLGLSLPRKTKAVQGFFPTPHSTQTQNTHSTLKSQGEMRIMGLAR